MAVGDSVVLQGQAVVLQRYSRRIPQRKAITQVKISTTEISGHLWLSYLT